MKIERLVSCYFGLFIGCMFYLVPLVSAAESTSVSNRQVDVITLNPFPEPDFFGWEPLTVDVRKTALNLHNDELYFKTLRVSSMADNAYFSVGTVHLLESTLTDKSDEIRQRAIMLLRNSRNPEAIRVLSNSMQKDSSWRVKMAAAEGLGELAGEAAVSALKETLTQDSSIESGACRGLGYAGGEGVPLLIEMLNEEVKKYGGNGSAMFFIQCLDSTLDRRAVPPLIDIISQPFSCTDPNWEGVREHAATVLAHFASDRIYAGRVQSRKNRIAEGYPVTPQPRRQLTPLDRIRIREALETAGYDIKRLEELSIGVTG